ncbi:MAG: hypothetical protein CVU11_06270 [Bacteroidetes bacterium HGW-Bacteroidetes-6]|jgi:signal transduction histidine kinase|nr:MAG: hypothetical protein CVU11_06270 [Bacteroidetes bacterium HGW-Bacteroidetes-6]
MLKKLVHKYFAWLLLVLAAVIIFSVVRYPVANHRDRDKSIAQFCENISGVASEMDSLLSFALNPAFLKDPFSLLSVESFVSQTQRLHTTLLITRNDSLIFWSNSSAPIGFLPDSSISDTIVFSGNGFYLFKSRQMGSYTATAMSLLESRFFYQNNYLPDEVEPDICKDCPFILALDTARPDTSVVISGFKNPVGLLWTPTQESFTPEKELKIIFFLFLALIFGAVAFYRITTSIPVFRNNSWLRLLSMLVFPAILFWIGRMVLSMPAYLPLSINNPAFFAFSSRFTHLTPLLLTSLVLIVYVTFFSRELLLFAGRKRQQLFFKVLFLFLAFLATSTLACFIINGISGFLFNTSVNFDFNDILTFDLRSIFIFFTLFLLFCSVILLHYLMISLVSRLRLSFKIWLLVSLVFVVVSTPAAWAIGIKPGLFVPVALYLLLMQFVFSPHLYSNKAVYLLLNLVFAAGLTTFALNEAVSQKQNDQMKLLSLNLATEQDPLTEDILGDIIPDISTDTFLLNNPYKKDRDFNITQYLKRNYFNGYLNQYLLQVTWCRPDEEIIVQPANTAVSCIDFFSDIAFRMGIPTLADEVVFVNDGSGRGYYLCTIELCNSNDTSALFAELIPASYEKGLGYPDLLVDVNSGIKTIPTGISYARYLDGQLISRYGKYNYPTRMSMLFEAMPDETVYHEGGQVHFRSEVSDNLVLVITQNDRNFSSFLAPFSYILLLFGLLSLLFVLSAGKVFGFRIRWATTFSSRLQWMIVLIILVIFFVAGIIAVYNLSSLNANKNEEIVSEKAHSLIVELEHKLGDYDVLNSNNESYLTELVLRFSRIFFIDLNIYSLDGKLLSTTRPQIFEKQLVSDRMDAQAYYGLSLQNNSFLLHTEIIGQMSFLSAYIPVRNSENRVIAYLNLPFFARGNELNREISSFISTFINIYMLIILFTVLITVLLSNYITHPLRMIKDKLRTIKLGTTNEKILWRRRDEIGDLVFEYNRMIEELAFKAELLARNEREMAWREMAKQVAHEIKNPLTPMKLSTQYLEKAWNDKAGDFDERLKRFAQTMAEQIDSLSDIATAFSNFGKMPESTVVRICLNDILSSVVTLYRSEEYDISLHMPDSALYVMADESQMLRVFNNLIKNAQQAFVAGRRGNVDVSLGEDSYSSEKNKAVVVVTDNGCGISPDLQKKIFQPNFTTKSSGTGLGLAMVKNIVDGFGGNITFESSEETGTTFKVELPLAE